jgi:hypothetical protein
VCCESHINPLNAELNPICHLLGLLGAHHILHISRIKVKPSMGKIQKVSTLNVMNYMVTAEVKMVKGAYTLKVKL